FVSYTSSFCVVESCGRSRSPQQRVMGLVHHCPAADCSALFALVNTLLMVVYSAVNTATTPTANATMSAYSTKSCPRLSRKKRLVYEDSAVIASSMFVHRTVTNGEFFRVKTISDSPFSELAQNCASDTWIVLRRCKPRF